MGTIGIFVSGLVVKDGGAGRALLRNTETAVASLASTLW